MKKYLIGLCLLLSGTFVKSQGLEGIVVEKFYVSNAADGTGSVGTLPTGSVTWRFYVDMAPGYIFQAAYGDGNHLLRFQTSTTFFNNEDRGSTNANAIGFNFIDDNTVMLDSYLSAGATCSNRLGVLKSEDDAVGQVVNSNGLLQHADPSAGIPLTSRDGQTGTAGTPSAFTELGLPSALSVLDATSGAGSILSTNNGSWASLAGASGPTATNRVLIAQITTDGVLQFELNVQIRSALNVVENYVASSPVGTEQLFAGLSGTLNQANASPTISITAPTAGSAYLTGDPVTIDATAADADGTVTNVQFLVDGVVVGSDATAPYSFTWTSTVGSHSLTARATDDLGAQTTSAPVGIIVGSVIAPTVAITSPTSGSTFVLGDVVNITANANDADGTVTQVEFFVNGVSVGVDATTPYAFAWQSVVGNSSLTAVATDDDNATATSAPISISVFDSSSAYVISTSSNPCSANTLCLPIVAITPVNDVIGYDIVLDYDKTKVLPSGVVTVGNALINPAITSTANSIDNANGKMYISVFFNASAPITAEFNGSGQLLCVEFTRTAGFSAVDTAAFSVSSLQESYFNGVLPKVVSPGEYITYQESDYTSNLKFWFDGSPIRYNPAVPTDYVITNIYGSNLTCTSISATAVQPDLAGNFTYDIANGPSIDIRKDIPATTSVQPVVNGFDAFLTRRVLINDPTYIPSVYSLIAMDVNIDGVVSAGDLSQINQRAVLIIGEFRQAWNYSAGGVSNGELSKDWLFVDQTTLNSDPSFVISSNYPFPDVTGGYEKSNVPVLDFCIEVPVFTSPSCSVFGIESYTGILMGDVNGNYATVVPNGAFRSAASDKMVFDLTKAVVENGVIEVPVYATAAETVNSLDFAMMFNGSKMSFKEVRTNESNLESLSFFNTADQALRFTSYSLESIDLTKSVGSVVFETASELTAEDFNSIEAFINGERVAAEVIGNRAAVSDVMVNVYPNPASSSINVLLSEDASVEIFDMNGKVVVSESGVKAFEKYSINTQHLAKGVYTLKASNAGFVTVQKVVIQ